MHFRAGRALQTFLVAVLLLAAALGAGEAQARVCGDGTFPFPNCGGDCFVPGERCLPDAAGPDGCSCQPAPCELSFAPQCGGPCPDPAQHCFFMQATGDCRCTPPLDCDHSTYPSCGGPCPTADEQCVPVQAGGAVGCDCEPVTCEQTLAPACGGVCADATQQCVPQLDGKCGCNPPPTPCGQSPLPGCQGDCPANQVCQENTAGLCDCGPTPCDQSLHPVCDGACPQGQVCERDPNGAASCDCQPIDCEDSPVASCNGACPVAGQQCQHNLATGHCDCNPLVECVNSPAPACDGPCPIAGDECVADAVGCHCETPTPCDQAPYPSCDASCPAGKMCVPSSTGLAECACEPITCELTHGPTCDGKCTNPAQECIYISSQDVCRCDPIVDCEGSPEPMCDGLCPNSNEECIPNPPGVPPGCNCEPIQCEQGPYPACDGVCPVGFVCEPDTVGGTGCRCIPEPCEASDAPTCDGPCTDPVQHCDYIAALDQCRCMPPAACENSPYPLCDTACPDGQDCVPGSTLMPPVTGCICEPTICQTSPAPTCDGVCQNAAQQCIHDTLTDKCTCDPPMLCDDNTPFPQCDRICPPGQECRPNILTGHCRCESIECEGSAWPQCDGPCLQDPSLTCQPKNDGTPGCHCADVPCVDTPVGQACDGPCPYADQTCTQGPAGCFCDRPHVCDQTTPYPLCDATCPDGQVCVPDNSVDPERCRCVPIPCEQSSPMFDCDGACPLYWQTCEPVPLKWGGCRCFGTQPSNCEATPFPTCSGKCPIGSECVPIATPFKHCECRPIVSCVQSPFPACQGGCPINTHCVTKAFGAGCACCPNIGPPIDDTVIHFQAKTIIIWQPSPCLKKWHLYRATAPKLQDTNGDGIYETVFDCFQPGLLDPQGSDPSSPPPGQIHWYLVTGVDDVLGESSMGRTSAGMERPNYSPCP